MNMLIDELQMLAASPQTWIVVAMMAVVCVHSMIGLMRCPYTCGRIEPGPDEIDAARAHVFHAGSRFALAMLTGIGLILGGLFMIAGGIKPTIALALLVVGVLVVQTEPARLQIREGKSRVVACHGRGEQALEGARARLRSSHTELVALNFGLLIALVGAILAF